MPRITLDEHIRQSRIAAEANKVKGNRHGSILADLYADPAHFVEEIIQNTEDACQRAEQYEGAMQISLYSDTIEIRHNGIPFDDMDVMAITTFGVTTKKNRPEINQIGKFGIGFRSVYGVTDMPEIHSGEYSFRICDYEVPEFITPQKAEPYTTLIRLPLKAGFDKVLKERLFEKIEQLKPEILLFLTCLKKIEIIKGNQQNNLSIHPENLSKDLSYIRLLRNGQITGNYLRYKRHGNSHKETAFALPVRDENVFVSVRDSALHVYFPTKVRFEHGFLVHARFTTTPNRENIPFDDTFTPENTETIKRLRETFALMVKYLKSKELLNASFFKLFDYNRDRLSGPAGAVLDELSDLLRNERMLKGQTGKPFTSQMLAIPENDLMPEIAGAKYLSRYFSVFDWVHSDYVDNRDFATFLKSACLSKWIDKETFAYTLKNHPEILEKQKTDYYKTFFAFLSSYPPLWDAQHSGRYYNLRFCPIIPVRGQKMSAPFNEKNTPLVYLKAKGRKALTVITELAENADSSRFLRQLGLPELAGGEEILRDLIMNFGKEKAEKWWNELLEAWPDFEDHIRERLIDFIKHNDSVPAELSGGIFSARKPGECCFARPELTIFLSGTPSAFVSGRFLHAFSNNKNKSELLHKILILSGVSSLPIRKPFIPEYPSEYLKMLRAENDFNPLVKQTLIDFIPEGLENFLKTPELNASVALCRLFSDAPESYFQGIYKWESYVRTESCAFKSGFLEQMRMTACLFDKEGKSKKPVEITTAELHHDYFQIGCDWNRLSELFGLPKAPEIHLSADELELIRIIRQNPGQKDEVLKRLSSNKKKSLPDGLKTVVLEPQNKLSPQDIKKTCKPNSAGPIAQWTGLFSTEWEIVNEFTEILIRYLMQEKLALNSDLKISRPENSMVCLKKGDIELSTLFAGGRYHAREPFVINKKILTCLEDINCNVHLFLFDFSSEPIVYEVKNPASFIKNNISDEPVIFLRW